MIVSNPTHAGIVTADAAQDQEPEAGLRPLRNDLQLLEQKSVGGGSTEWKLFDPLRNQFFKIGWLEFELLRRWSLGSAEKIIQSVRKETPLRVSPTQFQALQEFLEQRELLQALAAKDLRQLEAHAKNREKAWWMKGFVFTLYHRFPLFRPDPLLARMHGRLSPLFSKGAVLLLALAFVAAFVGITAHWYEFTDQFSRYMTTNGMIGFALVLLSINLIHEFGHGLAAHHFGVKVPRIGLALIFMMPMFYSDTSDSWRLSSRRQRMWIGAGGMLIESVLAIAATLAWLVLPDGVLRTLAYFVAVSSWAMTLLVNLNPFMKFDGYFLLSDALGIENLQDRAFTNFRWQLRKSLLGAQQQAPHRVPTNTHKIMCWYAFGTWIYRFFLYLGIAWMVYSFWFKALGIAMMAGVLALMLIKPIAKELKEYYSLFQQGALSERRWYSIAALACLMMMVLVPLPTKVVAPAVLSTAESAKLFAPQAAMVESILVQPGQLVSEGEPLLQLRDPDLEYQAKSLSAEIAGIEDRLSQERSWGHREGYKQVSSEDLASKQAALKTVLNQIELLQLKSPFEGRVEHIPDWVSQGTWVQANEVMAQLSAPSNIEVRAYIEAVDRERLLSASAWFYDNNGERLIELAAGAVSSGTIPMLDDTLLAVAQGGVIPTMKDEHGAQVPSEDWYVSTLMPLIPGEVSREQTGYLLMPASASSLLWRAVQRVYAAIIRESGF